MPVVEVYEANQSSRTNPTSFSMVEKLTSFVATLGITNGQLHNCPGAGLDCYRMYSLLRAISSFKLFITEEVTSDLAHDSGRWPWSC